ncbi:MAG: helix-turn-helix domain-containing protein, partial [Halomonas sp.]|nr:helix-turn-helix domain-containing protein [Halomonas sp.]
MTLTLSKTRSSFYRRLYVAHLIEQGISSVPALMEA